MASTSDKSSTALRSHGPKESSKDIPKERSTIAAQPPKPASPSDENVAQELEQLRDRYRRTTNALTSAAHDLKTPLAILNGYTELLQSEKLGPLNERQREVLRDMSSNGQRLQHFIQDFLTFSVLETGELRMQYEVGD